MINKDSKFKKEDDIIIKKIDNESVILNLKSGDYFTLNETGSIIINLLDGKRDLLSIATRLSSDYGEDIKKTLEDLLIFIKVLHKSKLIAKV